MNAGKSTALKLQSSYNYQERDAYRRIYAEIDDRFAQANSFLVSVCRRRQNCFNQNTSCLKRLPCRESERQTIHCVLVDEVSLLTCQQVYQLSEVVDKFRYSSTLLWATNRLSWGALVGVNTSAGIPISWWN
ncbi:hypothetical protein KCP75_06440 [Salmonella enterica subsp. enterica]|nr:hypothetical protein KCP75_06440 [Salmonella enterica subsp. enterica]